MNEAAQFQEMDVVIRFWDEETDEVKSRYLTSVFLTRSRAEDLLNVIQCFTLHKLFQLSMDGPNVNWKIFRLLQEQMGSDQDVCS